MKVFIAVTVISFLFTGVNAAGVPTCALQKDCISWTMEKLDPTTTTCGGNCDIKVCMTVDRDLPNCAKDGLETISHACSKAAGENGCSTEAWQVDEVVDITKAEFCQVGKPGDALQFVVKDASGSGDSVTFPSISVPVCDATATATVSCAVSTAETCTGTGNIGKERIWTFEIPDSACDCGGGGEEPPKPPCNPTFCEVCALVCPPTLPTDGKCPIGCKTDQDAICPEEPASRRLVDKKSAGMMVEKPHWLRA